MENTLSIAIVGMGLIGGSLGLAIKKRTGHTVIGIDRDEKVMEAVLSSGAADKIGAQHLGEADLLILALDPHNATKVLNEYASMLKRGAIVTDVCGVKRAVVRECTPICRHHGLHFVGGHPMAGKERGGFENAAPDLFDGAYYIFTPQEDTPDFVLERLKQLALGIGCAGITLATPQQHDRMIAFTSQLPHVLAGAYVKSPQCPDHKGFSAGSFRDVSRVATVDETLWTQLFLKNADYLCSEIDLLIQNLKDCRGAVADRDAERLEQVLRQGRLRKEGVAE